PSPPVADRPNRPPNPRTRRFRRKSGRFWRTVRRTVTAFAWATVRQNRPQNPGKTRPADGLDGQIRGEGGAGRTIRRGCDGRRPAGGPGPPGLHPGRRGRRHPRPSREPAEQGSAPGRPPAQGRAVGDPFGASCPLTTYPTVRTVRTVRGTLGR